MQTMEKNVEKQLIVRTFEPDMNAMKETAKQLAHMQDTTLNLYGNAGEVLVVVTARAHAQAAATELTENVAEQFELALGASAYGRGKGSLAYFTAGALIQSESILAVGDPALGAQVSEEFSRTKRGPSVFDFGDGSYNDGRIVAKIRKDVERYADDTDPAQVAAARAAAAAKYAHADYGAASCGLGSGSDEIYVAVAHRGYVYVRPIKPGKSAGKAAALSVLDLVRRIELKLDTKSARMFKKNSDFDWNEPLRQNKKNKYAAPIAVLAVLLIALFAACWYFFSNFSLGGKNPGGAMQVEGGVSSSEAAPAPEAEPQPAEPAPESVPAPAPSEPESKNTGVVTPFG